MKLKKLLQTAVTDPKALTELRQRFRPGVTVFVPGDDGLDIDATCAAVDYYEQHGDAPVEWGEDDEGREILTVDILVAFPKRQRLDPVRLKPLTPGLWSRLWDHPNGHELVAAVRWGVQQGHIAMSAMEVKIKVRNLLSDGEPWALLDGVIEKMGRDADVKRWAMDAVYPAVQTPASQVGGDTINMSGDFRRSVVNIGASPRRQTAQPSPSSQGARAALLALEREYRAGKIDIGRYLPLKAGMVEQLASDPTVLHGVLLAGFSIEEIKTLCFDLGVNYDHLPGEGIGKARELTAWMQRRRRTSDLLNAINAANPAAWQRYLSGR